MNGLISAFALGGVLVALPTAVIAVLIWVCTRGFQEQSTGSGLSSGIYAVLMGVIGTVVAALVFGAIGRWATSQQVEDRAIVALPVLLVICLVTSSKVPDQAIRGPLFGALGATAGAALYFPLMTAIQGAGDHSGLWGVGSLFAWLACGIPLLVVALIIAAVRARKTEEPPIDAGSKHG